VRCATDWDARFRAVDAVLTRALQPAPVDPVLVEAWHALRVGGGAVAALAEQLGWSPRRLSREFDREFGVSPKIVARLGRFDRARRELLRAPTVPVLADLAARHGYYDQAHLAREFRDFAGLSPTALLAAERQA
jgi:AraC-like DNA-binding protein